MAIDNTNSTVPLTSEIKQYCIHKRIYKLLQRRQKMSSFSLSSIDTLVVLCHNRYMIQSNVICSLEYTYSERDIYKEKKFSHYLQRELDLG